MLNNDDLGIRRNGQLKFFESNLADVGCGEEVWTSAPFRNSLNCALKFLNQFRRNALKNQF